MMDLFFLRHGDAGGRDAWQGDDRERPLTAAGKTRMRRQAKALARLVPGISLILCSPYTRAVQTAEIVARALGLSGGPIHDERLAPGFDVRRLRSILSEHARAGSLLLVGHDPDLSETLGACIGGGRVEMRKGALARVAVIDPGAPAGTLQWLAPPDVLAP